MLIFYNKFVNGNYTFYYADGIFIGDFNGDLVADFTGESDSYFSFITLKIESIFY